MNQIINRYGNGRTDVEKRILCDSADFLEWQIEGNSTKIVLGADTKTFTKLSRKSPELVVVDAGKTEIAPNTKTVICFWPMEKDSNKDIKRLQLL